MHDLRLWSFSTLNKSLNSRGVNDYKWYRQLTLSHMCIRPVLHSCNCVMCEHVPSTIAYRNWWPIIMWSSTTTISICAAKRCNISVNEKHCSWNSSCVPSFGILRTKLANWSVTGVSPLLSKYLNPNSSGVVKVWRLLRRRKLKGKQGMNPWEGIATMWDVCNRRRTRKILASVRWSLACKKIRRTWVRCRTHEYKQLF